MHNYFPLSLFSDILHAVPHQQYNYKKGNDKVFIDIPFMFQLNCIIHEPIDYSFWFAITFQMFNIWDS